MKFSSFGTEAATTRCRNLKLTARAATVLAQTRRESAVPTVAASGSGNDSRPS